MKENNWLWRQAIKYWWRLLKYYIWQTGRPFVKTLVRREVNTGAIKFTKTKARWRFREKHYRSPHWRNIPVDFSIQFLQICVKWVRDFVQSVSSFDHSLCMSFDKQLTQYRRSVLDSHGGLWNSGYSYPAFIVIQPKQRWISCRVLPSGQETQCCVSSGFASDSREITNRPRRFHKVRRKPSSKESTIDYRLASYIQNILLKAAHEKDCGICNNANIAKEYYEEIFAKVTLSISFIYFEWTSHIWYILMALRTKTYHRIEQNLF